ncbi:DUF7856 family protein [Halosimplex salinum]|uniref:DUF7856 family protein n=1 Tax=Halosimplex salinum TaxID=1710538 RepID=UPI000F46A26B|nr:hypothetical protein [Halosimplex salinum]
MTEEGVLRLELGDDGDEDGDGERTVDLRGHDIGPKTVVAAIRAASRDAAASGNRPIAVDCPTPGPVHEHVGLVTPSTNVRVRTALAAAARSRGGEAPQDEELADVRERVADLTVPAPPDLQAPRERLAGTDDAVERIRERVAALRGRVQAGREADRDVSELEADLAEATRELAERETERAAAREALERAERLARESRDARERRRRLEDRRANLERRARAHLVGRIREEYEAALAAVPGGPERAGERSESAEGASGDAARRVDDPLVADGVCAALAVGRVAALRAPVVVACDRFETPTAAATWLGAPVVRV